jgi:Rrf2 family transcriptional regulator, iron-sulfur cluster assembly transcription factor
MELSRRAKIALNLMVDLANRTEKKPLVLASAAVRLGSSPSHLESIAHRLRSRGLIEATRGPGGGYKLGRRAAEITVLEVILAADDSIRIFEHLLNQKLEGAEADDLTQTLLEETEREASSYLKEIKLSSLALSATETGASSMFAEEGDHRSSQWVRSGKEVLAETTI